MTTSKPRSLPLMFFSRLTASTPSSSLPPNCDRRIGAAEGRTQMRRCGSFGGASRNRSISSLGSPADEILMTWREAGPEARMTWGSRPYRHSREVVNLRRSDENGPDWLAPANRRCVCVCVEHITGPWEGSTGVRAFELFEDWTEVFCSRCLAWQVLGTKLFRP